MWAEPSFSRCFIFATSIWLVTHTLHYILMKYETIIVEDILFNLFPCSSLPGGQVKSNGGRPYFRFVQGVFLWLSQCRPPKIHKYGEKLKYQNWCPSKNSKCQLVKKILTLRTFWVNWNLDFLEGGSSCNYNFRGAPVQKFETFYLPKNTFRGAAVTKNTL